MSKGPRPTNKFRQNFDKIKWSGKSWTPPKPKPRKKVHHIIPDIAPYRAVAGEDAKKGRMITSRSHEREYLKRNGCIQVGNEWDHFSKYGGKDENNPTRFWNKDE